MKVKVLLDHVSREINFAKKLKVVLERLGIGTVDVSHQDFINTGANYNFIAESFGVGYDFLIVPNYNVKRTPETLLKAVASGAKLIIYHSEQIYNDCLNKEKLNLDFLYRYNKHVAAHFVWGDFYAEKLVSRANIPAEKIFVVGNYKFDFVKANRCLASSEESKRVLVASDFKLGDLSDVCFERFKNDFGIEGMPPLNIVMRKARENCLDTIFRLANVYPSVDFLLRPHPGENPAPYKKIVGGNIKLSSPGSTFAEDLAFSNFVVGYTSTSVLEIVASGKPFFSLEFYPFDKSFLAQHRNALDWVTETEFCSKIELLLQGKIISPSPHSVGEVQKIVKPYSDVVSNVVTSLIHLSEGNNATTGISAYDVFPLVRVVSAGVFKLFVLGFSNRFPFLPFAKKIISISEKSYATRVEQGEDYDDSILANSIVPLSDAEYSARVVKENAIHLRDFGFHFGLVDAE